MDKKILKELLAKKNVVSVGKGIKKVGGVSTGRQCIVIGVTKKLPIADLSAQDVIPKIIGIFPGETDVITVGEIRLL